MANAGSGKRKTKLDDKLPNSIKEKSYLTRQVDTSITILDSPEHDVVLESLLFLSKYADINVNNLGYLQQRGLLKKLLNLFDRNICILRLTLRLLTILLTIDDVFLEMDQEIYDDKVIMILNFYVTHSDLRVKEFCVDILSKLAKSNRVICLIFRADLLNPILITIKTTKNINLLESTMQFFYVLLNVPAALSILPTLQSFDVNVILTHMHHEEQKIVILSYKITQKLTSLRLSVFQQMFRALKLVEKMMNVVMDPDKKMFHDYALKIIDNCIQCEESSSYFIDSLEFLNFCQWVRTCDPVYILQCITIFEQLTRMPDMKQILYDFSVEVPILYFLRSTDKKILNKTCEAISNMTEHRYCCETMLTPTVLHSLLSILDRKDEEDPENEVALKTVYDFTVRSLSTIDMLYTFGAQQIMLEYFRKGTKVISEGSYLRVLEILYKFAVHPLYQMSIIGEKFFTEVLKLVQSGSDNLAVFATEMLTYFIRSNSFTAIFLKLDGPKIFLNKLKTTENMKLFKHILLFIYSSIMSRYMKEFILNRLIPIIKEMPDTLKHEAPLLDRILSLTYNVHLPLKLYETNRLEISDKLSNGFYLLTGRWESAFPFLEVLLSEKMSTTCTIYVVDYSYVVKKLSKNSTNSIIDSRSSTNQTSLGSTTSSISSMVSSTLSMSDSPFKINYGQLSSDPYLPRYIYHIQKYLNEEKSIKNKIILLAEYVETLLCGPDENSTVPQKIHTFKLHLQSLKFKLGTNLIPIGFLRIGFHCERALLFKAIADRCCIPCSLVKGTGKFYWNEIALLDSEHNDTTLRLYVVDLMNNVGNLLMVGSREANKYCNLKH